MSPCPDDMGREEETSEPETPLDKTPPTSPRGELEFALTICLGFEDTVLLCEEPCRMTLLRPEPWTELPAEDPGDGIGARCTIPDCDRLEYEDIETGGGFCGNAKFVSCSRNTSAAN